MKIGILITGHPPEELGDRGDYDAYFARLLGDGFTYDAWSVVDGVFPPGIDAADGWLLTGSRHGAYEPHDWIPPLEAFIRDAYAAGKPMIGVCFGHQVIAQALGGKVEKFSGGWSVGPTEYQLDGRPVTINAWHQDQVVEKPAEAVVIASSDFCKYAGFVYGDRIWSIQPHPEYDSDFIDGLIRTRGKGVIDPDILAEATAQLDKPTDRMDVARTMAEFFKRERA